MSPLGPKTLRKATTSCCLQRGWRWTPLLGETPAEGQASTHHPNTRNKARAVQPLCQTGWGQQRPCSTHQIRSPTPDCLQQSANTRFCKNPGEGLAAVHLAAGSSPSALPTSPAQLACAARCFGNPQPIGGTVPYMETMSVPGPGWRTVLEQSHQCKALNLSKPSQDITVNLMRQRFGLTRAAAAAVLPWVWRGEGVFSKTHSFSRLLALAA